jgi:putative flippase GtrA
MAASQTISRLIKFGLVGLTGIGVQIAFFELLMRGVHLAPLPAGLLSGVIATASNFVLNTIFTWKDRPTTGLPQAVRRLGKYYLTTGGGYLVYAVLFALTITAGIPVRLGNLFSVGVAGLVNFFVHSFWTWGEIGSFRPSTSRQNNTPKTTIKRVAPKRVISLAKRVFSSHMGRGSKGTR